MTKRANSDRIPTVPYETLTLEQLEACVRGELQAVWRHARGREGLRLEGEDLAEYEAAKARGWLVWTFKGWWEAGPLRQAWSAFCRATSRPDATVKHAPGWKTAYLDVRLPEGRGLPEPAVDRLHALLCAWVRKGHSLSVGTTALTAQLAGLDEASVLAQQLLDMVQELSTAAPEVHVHRAKRGEPHRYPAPSRKLRARERGGR
jgi:hypothetical protein